MIERGNHEDPVVVCVAPNGARKSRDDHGRIPLTVDELGKDALSCVEAGATVMHLHVRDALGRHSLDPTTYREAIAAIRKRVGSRLVIQVTTEAVGRYSPTQQMDVIRRVIPEAFSVALRELIPDDSSVEAVAEFFGWVSREQIGCQFILYNPSDVSRLKGLAAQGVLPSRALHGLFVLGSYQDKTPSAPGDLLPFLAQWPSDWPWTVCAFGKTEAQCLAAAAALGGHVRVGFENNLWNADGSLAASNSELIRNICAIIDRTGRARADVAHARSVYGAAR